MIPAGEPCANIEFLCGTAGMLLAFIALPVILAFILAGALFKWCWNYVMPDVFLLPKITFKQAIAMQLGASVLLAHMTIVFGGVHTVSLTLHSQ